MAPLIIIHNTSRLQTCNRRDWNRWTIRHGETTQGLPWHRKFRQLSTLQGWVSNKLFGWCQMLPEVRPPFLFTSLVMNFKTSSLLILWNPPHTIQVHRMDISYTVSSYKCLSRNLQFQIQSVRVLSTFAAYFSCLHQRSHSKEHVAFHAAKFSLGARGGGHGVVDHGLSGGALDLCRALGFTKGIVLRWKVVRWNLTCFLPVVEEQMRLGLR